MFKIVRDLLKHDIRFRIAFVFLLAVLLLTALSVVSPYNPQRTFKVPADQPPSLQYPIRHQLARPGHALVDGLCVAQLA